MVKHLKTKSYSFILGLNYCGTELAVTSLTLFLVQFNTFDVTVPGRVSRGQ